jgi:hypothetical protein
MQITCADRSLEAGVAALSHPPESFGHPEHVWLAWALLAGRPLLGAMCEFRNLLLAYAAHHGAADIYNETITCFYLILIRDRMDRLDVDHGWKDFQNANSDLFDSAKVFLEQWYPAGAAFSPEAKAGFRLPAKVGAGKQQKLADGTLSNTR